MRFSIFFLPPLLFYIYCSLYLDRNFVLIEGEYILYEIWRIFFFLGRDDNDSDERERESFDTFLYLLKHQFRLIDFTVFPL